MDIEEIKTLTMLMVDNDLSEIMIHDGEKRILLRRNGAVPEPPPPQPPAPPTHTTIPAAVQVPVTNTTPEKSADQDDGLTPIKSPMVGTYYSASDPESPPFVKIGDQVNPDTVIAIIEAMKVFNEIKADVAGTIESIKVKNASPVEFGQVLMQVRPD